MARNIKEDLIKIREFEVKLFKDKGTLHTYALRGQLQGGGEDLPGNMTHDQKARILHHRELNSLAYLCGVPKFSDSDLKDVDAFELDEMVTASVEKLRDLPDKGEPKEEDDHFRYTGKLLN